MHFAGRVGVQRREDEALPRSALHACQFLRKALLFYGTVMHFAGPAWAQTQQTDQKPCPLGCAASGSGPTQRNRPASCPAWITSLPTP